ncbi:MAG TPA: GDP-mannose 4,6-dehydratase [Thermoanaerobaculia bacterium]|jgi:GDP-4-dehydro-6-deoxy-D-mannose reductase|nr:GDP-mannose 4,6-dehydratase [Thermoanaerobaculia bacterium]
MHVLVTGVGGFIGAHLARHLLAQGDRVTGTYLDTPPDLPGVDLHEVDLLDRAGLEALVRRAEPDAVVSLAGLSHVGDSWKRMADYFEVNVLGTENLLAAASAAGNRPVVIASSAEVYGAVPEERQPIREEERVAPNTPYALTKAASERLALSKGAVVARSFNMVGPGQARTFALPAFAEQLAAIDRGEAEPVLRVGNLEARRDFVHVEDGAAAYRLLAERGEPGGIYNIASGRTASMSEALEGLMRVAGLQVRVEVDPERLRPLDLPVLCGDPSRLLALGWKPRFNLDDALGDLWAETRGAYPARASAAG